MIKRALSLVGIKSVGELEEIASSFPTLFFELSYAMTKEELDSVIPVIKNRISSLHALCPKREFFPNFGSIKKDVIEYSFSSILKDAILAKKFGANIIVLHPGYASENLIPTDNKKRLSYFETNIYERYISYNKGSICNKEYFKSNLYRLAFEEMKKNTLKLSNKLKDEGITLALENLNPRAGYLLIMPEEMIDLASSGLNLTLDIGHLWVTSELFNLSFLDEIKRIMDTKKVVNVHLHSNPSSKIKEIFSDTHESLDKFELPSKDALKILSRYEVNLTLETLEECKRNTLLLFENTKNCD